MAFTETGFLLALIPATLLAWRLPARAKIACLLLLSYGFYATWAPGYLAVLAGASALVYGGARLIGRTVDDRRRKHYLIACLVALLALLAVFKYPDWLSLAPGAASLAGIVAPIGISYYLFKAISYLLDVYWDTMAAERDPLRVALYLAFFPQILSGPIQRAPAFMRQTREPGFGAAVPAQIERGFGLMLLGLFEKLVLADRIGPFVAACDAPAHPPALMALLADQGYALQLFTDFSGLTHVAIGLGLLFGIEGPPNFNRPFSARNIQEFWRRWHMSLTTWLADYLFMPLRMTFRRFGTWGLGLSLMINMVAIGLWHGGRLTYLVFGVVHGLFLIGSALSLNARETFYSRHPALERTRGVTAPLVTFHMVVFGMVFFRAPSLDFALRNLHSIVLPQGDAAGWATLGRDIWLPAALSGLAGLLLGTGLPAVPRLGARLAPHFTWRRRPWLVWSGYAMGALTTVLLACETGGQFMYARF